MRCPHPAARASAAWTPLANGAYLASAPRPSGALWVEAEGVAIMTIPYVYDTHSHSRDEVCHGGIISDGRMYRLRPSRRRVCQPLLPDDWCCSFGKTPFRSNAIPQHELLRCSTFDSAWKYSETKFLKLCASISWRSGAGSHKEKARRTGRRAFFISSLVFRTSLQRSANG